MCNEYVNCGTIVLLCGMSAKFLKISWLHLIKYGFITKLMVHIDAHTLKPHLSSLNFREGLPSHLHMGTGHRGSWRLVNRPRTINTIIDFDSGSGSDWLVITDAQMQAGAH